MAKERFTVWREDGEWKARSNFGPDNAWARGETPTAAVERAHALGQEFTAHVLRVGLKHPEGVDCDCCSKMRKKYSARLDPPVEGAVIA